MRLPGFSSQESAAAAVDEEGQQIDRHDARLGDVRREHVALDERTRSATPAWRALSRDLFDQPAIELDAEAARAELRGGDDDAAVARAEVDHHVAGPGVRELQHPLHDLVRRGDERQRSPPPRRRRWPRRRPAPAPRESRERSHSHQAIIAMVRTTSSRTSRARRSGCSGSPVGARESSRAGCGHPSARWSWCAVEEEGEVERHLLQELARRALGLADVDGQHDERPVRQRMRSRSMLGISSRQGAHQVAQKFTSTTLPAYSASRWACSHPRQLERRRHHAVPRLELGHAGRDGGPAGGERI